MDGDDLEELDLQWQVAMLSVRVKKFIQRTGWNMDFKEKWHVSLDKSKIECYNCHRKGHFARECRSGRIQGRRSYGNNGRSNAPTNESSSHALMAQDGLGGYDWSNDFEVEPVNYALMAISSSSSSSSSDSEVQQCSKCLESFKCLQKNYDTEREKHNKAKLEIRGYEIALESLESRIIGHEKNELAWGEKYEFQNYELKCREIKINNLNLELEKAVKERDELKDKIAKWEESTKNLEEILKSQMSARDKTGLGYSTQLNELSSNHETDSENSLSIFNVKTRDEEEVSGVQKVRPENQIVKTRDDKSGQNSHKQGVGFRKVKACFVCRSTEHLIKDCNFHDKKSQESNLKNVVNTGKRESKPVWDNTKRVNHPNFSKYPHLSETFVPAGVSTRTGLHRPSINTARSVCTARPSINTARPVSTVRPSISTARPSVSIARPSVSTTRPVYATRPTYPRVQNMTAAGTRAAVNTGKGKLNTDLKRSKWVWRPKGTYLDHVSKDNGSFMLKKGNPEILLQDHAVVDSGCSSHMTGNKAYLSDYEDFNGGFVAFGSDPKGGKITGKGKIKTANLDFDDVYFVDELKFNLFSVSQMCDKKNSVLFTESECLILSPSFKLLDESQVVLRAPRKDDVYSLDLKNIVPSGGITCLYANATADESKLWHRRLGHVNFKNINKLVKGHLVRGLPSKVFVNDHTCVACKKGKQHKASCKAKLDRIIRKPLELLHMDLFGPVSVESINKKRGYAGDIVPLLPTMLAGAAVDQAPLPKGNTSGSAEDSVQLKELMVLVPKLVTRIKSLEKELKDTKHALGNVVLKLGRKIQDIDDDPLVSLVRESMKDKSIDFVTPTKASGEAHEEEISPTILEAAKTLSKVASQGVSKEKSTNKGKRYRRRARFIAKKIDIGLDAEVEINTGREEINTGIEEVSTGSTKVDSCTASEMGQTKGKAMMNLDEDDLPRSVAKALINCHKTSF
ncbi:putative ribonuclease H-like domain-containing protein [Tanacetum coccineum]|uniref:Ribonuclease H-like domain-containing protein n=1 Tax=Tanacetum coccineum TaxID=301880 RepID=A0ABQ4ZPW9_9ASTR